MQDDHPFTGICPLIIEKFDQIKQKIKINYPSFVKPEDQVAACRPLKPVSRLSSSVQNLDPTHLSEQVNFQD